MKTVFLLTISLIAGIQSTRLQAQTLNPNVIASAGGFSSTAAGSLSFTIGETNTKTLTSATHMLTQGFQQPFLLRLNLKAFIEGYYQGSGTMANVLYNQGVTAFSGIECDTVQIELRQSVAPYTMMYTTTAMLQTDGQMLITGSLPIGQAYYIVLKHRNAVETWSANPVILSDHTTYDFTTDASRAFDDNQVEVEPGVWSFYTGDIVKDENVDLLDLGVLEDDISNFQFGYIASDLNGDGNVDLLDSPTVEANINSFVFAYHP